MHALLGENGAGKTTLSNILTGLYRPDEGEIALFGEPVEFHSPRDALDAGIAMVHQHFRLVSPFTVAENVVLGDHRDVGRTFLFRYRGRSSGASASCRAATASPSTRARASGSCRVGEQQRVEILKALYKDARILILDEPTAVLTPQEADALFETIRAMAEDGRTVIFISHKLHEVKAVADRVTILRRGRSVATVPAIEATPRSLAALMVGREIEIARPEEDERERRRAGARARGRRPRTATAGRRRCADVSLTVRRGEIVAVAGVAGNGQRELAETIAGMRADDRRLAECRQPQAPQRRSAARRSAGVAYVPEDRLGTGVAPGLSVAANVVLKSYRKPPVSRGPMLVLSKIRELAERLMEHYDVRTSGPDVPAWQLSGGNLQKVVLAREFSGEPVVLVAASPTRGLDVAGIEIVHALPARRSRPRCRRAPAERGPRRDPCARGPDRRHVRGSDRRRA